MFKMLPFDSLSKGAKLFLGNVLVKNAWWMRSPARCCPGKVTPPNPRDCIPGFLDPGIHDRSGSIYFKMKSWIAVFLLGGNLSYSGGGGVTRC